MINNINAVYFSGTGTTEAIVRRIAETLAVRLSLEKPLITDFTPLKSRISPLSFHAQELVVLGVPVIAGRVPNLLLPYLKEIQGNGAFGVPIVLYGNRNFDDALVELSDLMEQGNMRIIGGGAFIGEHSFSTILAKGRPDALDFQTAETFAQELSDKIRAEIWNKPKLAGEKPYRPYYTPRDRNGNSIDIRKVKPKTDKTKCTNCKICAQLCPLGSIDFDDVSQTPGICMKCCACIKKCPEGAKFFDDPGYIYHKEELEALYAERKSPIYWL